MWFKIKQINQNEYRMKMEKKLGLKRQRKMRYSKQKPLQQMFDSEKTVGKGEA